MATDLGKVGMVMKGTYNSANTYETLDVVTYSNGLYVAKQNVPAGTLPTNTTYWQVALENNDVSKLTSSELAAYKGTGVVSLVGGLTKVGRQVVINIGWTGNVTGNNAIINIPSAYRPAGNFYGVHYCYLSSDNDYFPGVVTIDAAGDIKDGTSGGAKTSGVINLSYYI